MTPANADVVAATLRLIDRVRARHAFTRLIGDLLYTNLRADRWAVALAERGIEQALMMRSDNHGVVDILGALMQHGWLHCPAAPMTDRPMPPTEKVDDATWQAANDAIDAFQRNWAFARKESGLGANPTSKWICQARDGRAGCWALGQDNVQAAIDLGLPVITPPEGWRDRKCCTQNTIDFTPDPTNPHHQRKLMQRYYYGSHKQRRAFKRRTLVEGAFGILKNASRLRMRRGQNRLPGLAIASILAAIKVSLFNEEQLRAWHERTDKGPVGHPLLRPEPPHHGHHDLTEGEAKAIDETYLRRLRDAGNRGDQAEREAA
jgi:hypothetical protein